MTTMTTSDHDTPAPSSSRRGRVALFDISHVFRRAWHASADQELSVAYEYTVDAFRKATTSNEYVKVIACVDRPPYKRSEFFPAYKANRPQADPMMREQLERVLAHLRKMGVPVVGVEGFEADDIIATLAHHLRADKYSVHIHTNDKDLMQLVRPGVALISTTDGKWYDEEEVELKMGVPPRLVRDMLALMGDKSDNVPGCPGVGPAKAVALLKEHGSVENILAAEEGDIKGKLGQVLRDNVEQIMASQALVTLMIDAPVDYGAVWEEPKMEEDADERAAIQAEGCGEWDDAPDTDPAQVTNFDPEAEARALGEEPSAGDRLVAGALAAQEAVTREAIRPLAKASALPVPAVPGETAPGAELQLAADAIELRPGVMLTAAKYNLMVRMSKAFAASGLYRRKFDTAEAIFTVMELGLELGISPQVALNNFHMIEGKPSPAAHFLIGMASRDPNCDYFECVEETDTSVTYETRKRSGYTKPLRFTYTMEDADRAGLLRSGRSGKPTPWQTQPRSMLRKTAGSQAARLWYPAACSGLYSMEELGHDVEEHAA